MIDPTVPTLPNNSMLMALDAAHQQGFRQYLSAIGHEPYRADHRVRASNALTELRRTLNASSVPDYDDPYIAAAYMVSYHLSHCILAYWSFQTLFRRYGIPNALYVCDVGAGTGAGFVGLELALSECSNSPLVYFDEIEPCVAMMKAGVQFRYSLWSEYNDIPNLLHSRTVQSIPGELPDIPDNALRVVTAFHLSLPYNDQLSYRPGSIESEARRSIQSALRLVCPDVGLFTCHEGKDASLRRAVDDTTAWIERSSSDIEIPGNNGGVPHNSSLYTNCAADLGFDVSEGTSVRHWSRHRFSLPKGILLLRVSSPSERERTETMRIGNEQELREQEERCKAAEQAGQERQRLAEEIQLRRDQERERQRQRQEEARRHSDRVEHQQQQERWRKIQEEARQRLEEERQHRRQEEARHHSDRDEHKQQRDEAQRRSKHGISGKIRSGLSLLFRRRRRSGYDDE